MEMDKNFDERIRSTIVYLILAGFGVLFLNYILQATVNTAAERQINKMRLAIFCHQTLITSLYNTILYLKNNRDSLYKSIIRQELSFFDKNDPGDLNSVTIA